MVLTTQDSVMKLFVLKERFHSSFLKKVTYWKRSYQCNLAASYQQLYGLNQY